MLMFDYVVSKLKNPQLYEEAKEPKTRILGLIKYPPKRKKF
jgi:hypothetical protein